MLIKELEQSKELTKKQRPKSVAIGVSKFFLKTNTQENKFLHFLSFFTNFCSLTFMVIEMVSVPNMYCCLLLKSGKRY